VSFAEEDACGSCFVVSDVAAGGGGGLFSWILENAALNLAGVISWSSGEMFGGFFNVRMNPITSGMGSLTSKLLFIIWLAQGGVPSNHMSSARGSKIV
jgi:hypothetical protein